jgi:tRNA pseudouridine55 synthase
MPDAFHGLLVFDKPAGMTSRDVVNRALAWFPRGTRIGHAGTLDPLATGVLVVCVGNATRLVEYVQRMEKTYQADLVLGARSDTDDAEGRIEKVDVVNIPSRGTVVKCLEAQVGELLQVPPSFSAARVAGRRAYELARKGRQVVLEPRRVQIYAIDLGLFDFPRLRITVRCGKGTYIRSLARDIGEALGCGAFVDHLRRLCVGCFNEKDALPINLNKIAARSRLLPLETALVELPRVVVRDTEAWKFRNGQAFPLPSDRYSHFERGEDLAVLDDAGTLIGIGSMDENGLLGPTKGLAGGH